MVGPADIPYHELVFDGEKKKSFTMKLLYLLFGQLDRRIMDPVLIHAETRYVFPYVFHGLVSRNQTRRGEISVTGASSGSVVPGLVGIQTLDPVRVWNVWTGS